MEFGNNNGICLRFACSALHNGKIAQYAVAERNSNRDKPLERKRNDEIDSKSSKALYGYMYTIDGF